MSKLVEIDNVSGVCSVLHVLGDINLKNSPELRAALRDLLNTKGQDQLVLDLEGVKRMDSSGVATLIEGWQEANRNHTRFMLAGLNEMPRRVLDLTRLSGVFEITPTVEEALHRFRNNRRPGGAYV